MYLLAYFGIGFNQAKSEEQPSLKVMQGINVCKWGVYRRMEQEGLLLPFGTGKTLWAVIKPRLNGGE